MTRHRSENVFLVRMWREPDPAGQTGWRGSVHDVATGRRLYVRAAAEVSDFIDVALRQQILTEPVQPEDPTPLD